MSEEVQERTLNAKINKFMMSEEVQEKILKGEINERMVELKKVTRLYELAQAREEKASLILEILEIRDLLQGEKSDTDEVAAMRAKMATLWKKLPSRGDDGRDMGTKKSLQAKKLITGSVRAKFEEEMEKLKKTIEDLKAEQLGSMTVGQEFFCSLSK